MSTRIAFLALILLAGLPFAQGASEYCSSEKAEGESCYRNCCEMLGYSWDSGGCMVSDAEQDYVSSECGYCANSYIECVADYESGGSGGSTGGYPSSGGSGCCSGFIVLSLLGFAVLSPRV